VSEKPDCFILRIQKDEVERKIFSLHTFYIGISRDWTPGACVLFLKKDAFICSGVIDRIIKVDSLQDLEKSWYAQLVFGKVSRFVPPVPLQETLLARLNPLSLHGATISQSDAARIEALAVAKIIS